MDIIDQANEFIEFHLNKSLKKITQVKPIYTGFCIFCGELCGERRYCDKFCREDHEKQMKRK